MKAVNTFCILPLIALTACSSPEEVGRYPTGEIEYRVPLNEYGVYDGVCTYFYKTGAKKTELPFVNHRINGLVKRYYPSGRLLSASIYKNGQQWGEIKSYYPSGELRSQGYIYGMTPQGPMHYVYRNGELQHLRIYDKRGKVVDFAEFDSSGTLDKRYTQPLVYTNHDTVEINKEISFEVILASRASEDISVKIGPLKTLIDSTVGVYTKHKYKLIFHEAGKKCISGTVYQREHHNDTTITTSFPWKHCFYSVVAKH